MNNYSCITPHTIKMDNSAVLLNVQLGDRVSLLPRSCVHGGTQLADGVLLGSHCRPFRGQMVTGDAEYNDTPCTAFVKVKARDGLLGQEDGDGELLISRGPLTKPHAIEIIREVLVSLTGGKGEGYSLPTPADSSGIEEIQLDSIELVEFAEQLKRRTHINLSIDALLDLVTVSNVADALLSGELELHKEEPTENANFDLGIDFKFNSHKAVHSGK